MCPANRVSGSFYSVTWRRSGYFSRCIHTNAANNPSSSPHLRPRSTGRWERRTPSSCSQVRSWSLCPLGQCAAPNPVALRASFWRAPWSAEWSSSRSNALSTMKRWPLNSHAAPTISTCTTSCSPEFTSHISSLVLRHSSSWSASLVPGGRHGGRRVLRFNRIRHGSDLVAARAHPQRPAVARNPPRMH
jgi:hypothetical protein